MHSADTTAYDASRAALLSSLTAVCLFSVIGLALSVAVILMSPAEEVSWAFAHIE